MYVYEHIALDTLLKYLGGGGHRVPTAKLSSPEQRVRSLLEQGYRWIRTDGLWAIFEKEAGGPQYVRTVFVLRSTRSGGYLANAPEGEASGVRLCQDVEAATLFDSFRDEALRERMAEACGEPLEWVWLRNAIQVMGAVPQ